MSDCIEHHQKAKSYGRVLIEGVKTGTHRAAYCKAHGLSIQDIDGIVIRHTCDNQRCVNPDHLVSGTHMDNMMDKVARNRQQRLGGSKNGRAKLNDADVAEIRRLYVPRSFEFGAAALARRFEVHSTTIDRIVSGKSWSR
ncbi:HNH endonuclease [Burkholderia multivorans]|uniref:HNH endonuclease n=1 Tax=Burkholderia multivorans TaxID=87883 RepID=UPI00111F670A|nr:HNH endonuclease [Burkholderia multivorans]MDN8078314.1 HNH endonuclease [Burkholderia multivorans]